MIKSANSTAEMATDARRPIGEMLIERGLISEQQLREALEHQAQMTHRKLIGEILVDHVCLRPPPAVLALLHHVVRLGVRAPLPRLETHQPVALVNAERP